jgi:hypothetical protein
MPTQSLRTLLLAILIAGSVLGQSFTSTITGTVTDPSGAAVPGADVSATNLNTREVRRVQTDALGRYNLPQLLPAAYSISVGKTGFRDYVRTSVDVGVSRTLEINVTLALGQVSQALEVSSAAPLIDTQTADQSLTYSTETLNELPRATRNVLTFAQNLAGVVSSFDTLSDQYADQNTNRFSMNGGRELSAQILIDGVPATAGFWAAAMVVPGGDSVQAFQIISNTYDAQYGKTSGGVMNITTKGGSSAFHGNVFGSIQNDNLNANSFFNNLNNVPKIEAKRINFGATLSGPLWKTKRLFWQVGYEGLRRLAPAQTFLSLPTELQRGGNFSETYVPSGGSFTIQTIYDPLTIRPNPAAEGRYLRDAFPGNIVPPNRFDKVGQNVMKYYPQPNQPGDPLTNARNFYKQTSSITETDRYDFRIDWARTEKHTLYGRGTVAPQFSAAPLFYDNPFDTGTDYKQRRYNVSLVNTFIVNPTLVLNVLFGVSRWKEDQVSPGMGFDATTLGWSAATVGLFDEKMTPTFYVNNAPTLGNSRFLSAPYTNYSTQINGTKQQGSHTIKFGWVWDQTLQNRIDAATPRLTLTNLSTRGPDPDLSTSIYGNGLASLLLGLGSGGSVLTNFFPAGKDSMWSWYVQDAWRLNNRLTINYGVRYEIQTPRTERFNRLSSLDLAVPNPLGQSMNRNDLYGGLVFRTAEDRYGWEPDYRNLAPRLSIALKLSNRLVLRSGFGIYFMNSANTAGTTSATGYTASTPWVATVDSGRTYKDPLSDPFPQGLVPVPGATAGLLTSIGAGVSGFLRDRPTPYMQRYSLDIQYQLTANDMVAVGYSGSGGRRLSWGKDVQLDSLPAAMRNPDNRQLVDNPFYGYITTPGLLSQPKIERGRLLLPYPHFTSVSVPDQPGATSSYHALVVNYARRFSKGLMIEGEYRYSKSLDNASANVSWLNNDTGARDWYDLGLERSVSSFDVPHAAAITFLVQLPVGKGRRFGSDLHPVLDALVGGWSAGGTQKFQSGQPTLFTAPNNAFCYGCAQYPNVRDRSQLKLEDPNRDRWFNTEPFSMPADYTVGNMPRYVSEVRSDHMNNLDLAVSKEYRVRERVRAQVRAEMLNSLNRNRFGNPNTSYSPGSVSFGRVSSSRNLPRIIQLTLRITF